jgi:hypothetical protein
MTHEEFLKKYPRPWKFSETGPGGGGVIADANGQTLVLLEGDRDWRESGADPKIRPVFNGSLDDDGGEEAEREAMILVDFLLGSDEE